MTFIFAAKKPNQSYFSYVLYVFRAPNLALKALYLPQHGTLSSSLSHCTHFNPVLNTLCKVLKSIHNYLKKQIFVELEFVQFLMHKYIPLSIKNHIP